MTSLTPPRKRTLTRSKRRGICHDCGRPCFVEIHHEPPKSMGGGEEVPLCRRCHVNRHCKASHWAAWGRKGGQHTQQQHATYKRNFKQFRAQLPDPAIALANTWESYQ